MKEPLKFQVTVTCELFNDGVSVSTVRQDEETLAVLRLPGSYRPDDNVYRDRRAALSGMLLAALDAAHSMARKQRDKALAEQALSDVGVGQKEEGAKR